MLTDEQKKQIEALTTDEMAYEINLGRLSRFQREKFAYLKTCHQLRASEKDSSEIPHVTPGPTTDSTNEIHYWHNKPLGKIFIIVVGGILLLCVIWAINHYLSIGL
jgi:hypothetical protein